MAEALEVVGLMNVQFAVQHRPLANGSSEDVIYVLEVNPRASRTVPFVSKATGIPLAKVAARCMAGSSLAAQGLGDGAASEVTPPYFSVKEAVFPFVKFPGVDTILGPEMKSTGEVMGVGYTFGEAFIKSQIGAGTRIPQSSDLNDQGQPRKVFMTVKNSDKGRAIGVARELLSQGFELVASSGTQQVLVAAGLPCGLMNKVAQGRPHIVDAIKNNAISLVINTVEEKRNAIQDSRAIRTSALQSRVTTFTTIAAAEAALDGMKYLEASGVARGVISVQEMHARLQKGKR
jgi:carbamoyl-phosphate synthase large subunit